MIITAKEKKRLLDILEDYTELKRKHQACAQHFIKILRD
jgi:hypothetical protein